MLTLMVFIVGEMFGFFPTSPELSAVIHRITGGAFDTMTLSRMSRTINAIGISLRIGLLYLFPLLTILLQIWALVEKMLRRKMVGRLVFSGAEEEWM